MLTYIYLFAGVVSFSFNILLIFFLKEQRNCIFIVFQILVTTLQLSGVLLEMFN